MGSSPPTPPAERIAIVTGANTGIGKVTATELAKQGGTVILACRSEQRAAPALKEIEAAAPQAKLEFLELDLNSLAAVKKSAETFLATERSLHVLVNNAGLAGRRGITEDGFELAFGVNHLGHYLFTRLLLERLEASAPARIVNVASKAHYQAPGIDYEAARQHTKAVTGLPEYESSKLANVLFTRELARRLEGKSVNAYSLHPGVVASDVWREVPGIVRTVMKWFMISNEEGAKTSVYCASSADVADESGLYYDECQKKKASTVALNDELAAELWAKSESWVASFLA